LLDSVGSDQEKSGPLLSELGGELRP